MDDYWMYPSTIIDFFGSRIRAELTSFNVYFHCIHVCLPFINAHASWQSRPQATKFRNY